MDGKDQIEQVKAWWRTSIIDVHPGSIHIRGYPIEQLIGRIGYPQMVWLMVHGDLPTQAQAYLFEATLLSMVDHGPHAPSIAVARMAATCGVEMNGVMAIGAATLGDVHGGAIEQCMELYLNIANAGEGNPARESVVADQIERFSAEHGPYVPGFGHRFHPLDPRSQRLLSLADAARREGTIAGTFVDIARAVEADLERRKGKAIPMNIDGAAGAVYLELGFSPTMGRGLLVLSRSVGILAHAVEQKQQGGRIKGPMPRSIPYTYEGPSPRDLPEA